MTASSTHQLWTDKQSHSARGSFLAIRGQDRRSRALDRLEDRDRLRRVRSRWPSCHQKEDQPASFLLHASQGRDPRGLRRSSHLRGQAVRQPGPPGSSLASREHDGVRDARIRQREDDPHKRTCRTCRDARVAEWKAKNPDRWKAYEQGYNQTARNARRTASRQVSKQYGLS